MVGILFINFIWTWLLNHHQHKFRLFLYLKEKTRLECDELILKTRKDAQYIQEGANKYAEQTLIELEERIKQINHVLIAGRQELGKIHSISTNEKYQIWIPGTQLPYSAILNQFWLTLYQHYPQDFQKSKTNVKIHTII